MRPSDLKRDLSTCPEPLSGRQIPSPSHGHEGGEEKSEDKPSTYNSLQCEKVGRGSSGECPSPAITAGRRGSPTRGIITRLIYERHQCPGLSTTAINLQPPLRQGQRLEPLR
ncbi:hypothetical protein ACOMHN_053609 [Nucella lapillus]